jgi:hypothetical protein
MDLSSSRKPITSCAAAFLFSFVAVFPAQTEVVELEFKHPPNSGTDADRTLASLVKVQSPGGIHLNGLYLLTHYGNREELFSQEHQSMKERPLIERPWRYCSVFSSGDENHMIVGRNWDNENVGSIIVSLYRPEKGFSSISFSRSIDMNFPLNIDLVSFRSHPAAKKLLLSPFYSFDGINEHGFVVSVAGVNQVSVRQRSGKELIYVPLLIRILLDQSKTIEEAIEIVDTYVPFDLDQDSLNSHFFVADASGRSVILEYVDDEWKKFFTETSWQVLENRPIHSMTDEELRAKGWRYRTMSESLESAEENLDWEDGLRILKDVAQKGTSWSVIYSPTGKDLYFSVYQQWDTVYHLTMK